MKSEVMKALGTLEEAKLPELWRLYGLATNEKTKCPNKTYLIRKIREAANAEKPAPARSTERAETPNRNRQVIPLRMSSEVLQRVDEARERLGIKNRSVLLLDALHDYLNRAGEKEVADLLQSE